MGQIPTESKRIVIRKIIRFFRPARQPDAPLKGCVKPCGSGPRGPDSDKGWKPSNLRFFHVTLAFILLLTPQKAPRMKRTTICKHKKARDSSWPAPRLIATLSGCERAVGGSYVVPSSSAACQRLVVTRPERRPRSRILPSVLADAAVREHRRRCDWAAVTAYLAEAGYRPAR
jgi:hypothetical protein